MGFVLMGTWILNKKRHDAAASVNAAQKKTLSSFSWIVDKNIVNTMISKSFIKHFTESVLFSIFSNSMHLI